MSTALPKLVIVFSLILMAGALSYRFATAGPGSDKSLSAPAASPGPTGVRTNPEEGLTDSERFALHQRLRAEFENHYAEWVSSLDLSKLDLHSPPRGSIAASYIEPEPSLEVAAAKADMIVMGMVTSVRPVSHSLGTTLSVEQTIKGGTVASLALVQAGGLEPGNDWEGVILAQGDDAPPLLPGDRALLFLQKLDGGEIRIQPTSGWYQIVDGRIKSVQWLPDSWVAGIEGKTEAEFIGMVQEAMRP